MARKLAANVYVGETLYRAGTSPEKEIADQITNPKAWGEAAKDDAPADPPADPPAAPPAGGDDAEAKPAPAKKAAAPRKRATKKAASSSKSE